LSIKTFLKTSKNQTNCDILTCSFSHRQSSEEPNYTPTTKNRQLPNNKKFYKNRQQPEIQQLLFQNPQNIISKHPQSQIQTAPKPSSSHNNKQKLNTHSNKGRLKSVSDDLCCSILHHILPILLIQKITLPNITSPR